METVLFSLFAILIGVLLTFAGYQFFRVLIPLWGFFVGFTWGAQGVAMALGEGFLATGTSWVIGFIVALVVAALAYLFYELAVAILAGSLGYWLVMALFVPLGLDGYLAMAIALVAAVALGVFAIYIKAPKGLLIVLSAFGGAIAIIGGLLALFGVVPLWSFGTGIITSIIGQSFFWVISLIVLAASGIATQMALSREISEADVYSQYGAATGLAGAKGGEVNKEEAMEDDIELVDEEDYEYPEKKE